MAQLWPLVILLAFQTAHGETSPEYEAYQHLTSLEDEVYFPISVYLSNLGTQLESLITNITNYELDANDIINSHSQNIRDDANTVIDTLKENEIDVTHCLGKLDETVRELARESVHDVKDEVLYGLTKGQDVISDARNIFRAVQNKTVDVRREVQNCRSTVDPDECLLDAMQKIILMKYSLRQIIHSAGEHHDLQLVLLEENVIANLENIIVGVFDHYVELLDDFLLCTLTW